MTTPTSATIVNALVAASCITVGAIAQNSTRAEKDEAQQQEMVRQAECDAISAAYGVDPWRGTSIGTLVRQREEAAAKSQAEEQMTLMTAHSDTADSDDPSEASDEEPTVEEIASNGVASAEPLSDLHLTNFSVVDGGVQFDFELDSTNSVASTVEIFSTTNLTAGVWNHEFSDPIPAGVTNHTTFLAWSSALIPQSFYAYGWPTDSDGDGVPDSWEEFIHGTNPYERDSDFDGIDDRQELILGTNPLCEDTDGDGLWDDEEVNVYHTNPLVADTDGDGLSDWAEISIETNPLLADSDGDGLSDGFEVGIGSDPLNADTDGDGVSDGEEHSTGRDIFMDERTFVYDGESSYDLIGTMRRVELVYDENSTGLEYENIEVDDVAARRSVAGIDMPWTVDDPFMYMLVGMKFRPRYSGCYTFQISADDYAWVKVGSVRVEAAWQAGAGLIVSGYFDAGQEYDVTVFHRNDGGPTYLHCLKFGEFCHKPIILTNELTNNVLIYEKPYENIDVGATSKGRYLKTRSKIVACAGPTGGILTITTEGMECMECISGPALFSRTVFLGPNEVYNLSGSYKGCKASDAEGDIKIRTTLTINGVSDPIVEEVSATAIEVSIECKPSPNGGAGRHRFGPLEFMTFRAFPQTVPVTWSYKTAILGPKRVDESCSYEYVDVNSETSHEVEVRMPIIPVTATVLFGSLGRSVRIPLTVVLPDHIIGWNPTLASVEQPYELWCGYTIDAEVCPSNVSFEHIRIKEGVCDAYKPKGTLSGLGPHDSDAGAEHVCKLGWQSNYQDFVYKGGIHSIDGDWSGQATWKIPVYWQPITDATNLWTRGEFTVVNQVFRCNKNGVLSIEKLGCYGERDLSSRTKFKCKTRR